MLAEVSPLCDAIVLRYPCTIEHAARSNILQEVDVPTFNTEECERIQKKNGKFFHPASMLCAGYNAGGKDSCKGDSGGPYFFNQTGTPVLHGLVSWGPDPCAVPNNPGVYARVSPHVEWIQKKIRELTKVE